MADVTLRHKPLILRAPEPPYLLATSPAVLAACAAPERLIGAAPAESLWLMPAGARCGRWERHDPSGGLRRPGPAIDLAHDEQARVLPAAERAGEGAAIQLDRGQHL